MFVPGVSLFPTSSPCRKLAPTAPLQPSQTLTASSPCQLDPGHPDAGHPLLSLNPSPFLRCARSSLLLLVLGKPLLSGSNPASSCHCSQTINPPPSFPHFPLAHSLQISYTRYLHLHRHLSRVIVDLLDFATTDYFSKPLDPSRRPTTIVDSTSIITSSFETTRPGNL
jgi:hypothetical protein